MGGASQDAHTNPVHVRKNLSHTSVSYINQDTLGYLWVGTRYGLNKYLGHQFKSYLSAPSDTTGILNSHIAAIENDSNGDIWIATHGGGVSRYDIAKENFTTYRYDASNVNTISSDYTSALLISSEGYLFIGLEREGLCMIDTTQSKVYRFSHRENDRFSISSNDITTLAEDGKGNIWVGTWDSGINRFDYKTGKFYRYMLDEKPESGRNRIRTLYHSQSQLYVGTNKGLFVVNEASPGEYTFEQVYDAVSEMPILSVLHDRRSQELWIGTENFGIFNFKEGEAKARHNMLENNSIWSLFQDRAGIIWIGTYKDGLYKIDAFENRYDHVKNEPNKTNTISYNIISSFAEDDRGNLWIGTDGGGLNYLNVSQGEFEKFVMDQRKNSIASNAIVDILIDKKGTLWLATWEGGVNYKFKGSSVFNNFTSANGTLLGDNIFSLLEDDKERIWMSSFRDGLNVYDPSTGVFVYVTEALLGSKTIRTMYQDLSGNFWFGTEGEGLFYASFDDSLHILEKRRYVHQLADSAGLSDNTITDIYQSNDSVLWISTEGGGLNKINVRTQAFTRYTDDDGLASNVIYSIEEDDQGFLWLSSGNGLSRFNIDDQAVKNYDVSDGIQSSEFFKGSSLKTSKGELFFGGINGYNHFYPDQIRHNKVVPKVRLTSFKVNDESYSDEGKYLLNGLKEVNLKHDQNDLKISFVALNYSQPEKNRYRYLLEGFDNEWNEISQNKEASYTNIPPGDYAFKVMASNNDGVWNEDGVLVSIHIAKPWWQTIYAKIFYFIATAMLLFFSRKSIINKERLKTKLKLEHLELLKMQELDEIKNRFYTNISHEFKTPLTLILEPLKQINRQIKNELWKNQFRVMIRNAEGLLRLVNSLLDVSRLESNAVKLQASPYYIIRELSPIVFSFNTAADTQFINYKCIFPKDDFEVYFDKERIEKVVLNLLSNAFKFTPEYGEITFEIKKEKGLVRLTVQDSGIGISKEDQLHVFDRFYRVENTSRTGTGVGLALVREIMELHKGEIIVESKPDYGTIFSAEIPLGKDHLKESEIVTVLDRTDLEEELMSTEDMALAPIADSDLGHLEIKKSAISTSDDLQVILVAEDNYEMRSYVCKYLESTYKIEEADNGALALEIARNRIPDLIICDVNMPEMNGYQLCASIKEDEMTSHIPVIMLTGKTSDESAELGFSHGADYYISKPFNTKLLELRIRNILISRENVKRKVLSEHTRDIAPSPDLISPKEKTFIDKVVLCIEENMSNADFHIDDLCREIGTSRMQLYRKLKGIVGQSANEFIRTIRLKKAAQFLQQKQYSISEVTYKVGFTDLHYFRGAFKKQFGMNPSDYKENS